MAMSGPSATLIDKARVAMGKGDYHTALAQCLEAEKGAAARPMADIALTLGQVRMRVRQFDAAETSLRQAMELARRERNVAAERAACLALGTTLQSKSPPQPEDAIQPLGRAFQLCEESVKVTTGKNKRDPVEHMKAGNAFAKALRRAGRFEEAAEVFMAVARVNYEKTLTKGPDGAPDGGGGPEEHYDFQRAVLWDRRPVTAVTESRFWSGVGFQEQCDRAQLVKPLKPQEAGELFTSLKTETPHVFKFSSWGDPQDGRPDTSHGDREKAMKRLEAESQREAKERALRRKEAGLPPV